MAVQNYSDGRKSDSMSSTPAVSSAVTPGDGADGGRASGQPGEKIRQKGDNLADKAADTAKQQIGRQKDQAASRLSHVSGALRSTSDHLREEDESSIADYVEDAAAQVDRFVGFLEERSPEDLLHETRHIARRDPALFLGGAALLGMLGARFLRSSNRHRDRYESDIYAQRRRVN